MKLSEEKTDSLFGLKRSWIFFCGILIGMGDLIPAISGGTIALVLGIYLPLLESIKRIDSSAIRHLVKGDFNRFCQRIHLQFLILLASGILCSVLFFSKAVCYILHHQLWVILFFSFLVGILGASAVAIARREQKKPNFFFFWIGIAVCSFINLPFSNFVASPNISSICTSFLSQYRDLTFFLGGILGGGVMLIPVISGSFVLFVLGLYEPLIGAAATLTTMQQEWKESIRILLFFISGVLMGFALFSRLILFCFHRYLEHFYLFFTGMILACGVFLGFSVFSRIGKIVSGFTMLYPEMILIMIFGYILFYKFQLIQKIK